MTTVASSTPEGFDRFDEFLREWSRRDFLRRMGGAAAFAAFTAGGLEFLEACGTGGGSSSTTTPKAKNGGHVVEGNFSDISYMNPVLSSDTASNTVINLLFDGLLGSKANGDLEPMIAEAMPTVSSDQLTYTFKLRKDVKWTDGQQVTSDDVLFTYNLMFAPDYKDVNSPRRSDLTLHVDSITAPDPYTVVFKTKEVWAPFLALHGQYGILPKHVLGTLAGKAINTADFNAAPSVTNGVFKFVRWDKGQQVVLARNDTYYRGAAHLDQYVYKVVPDQVTLVDQLKTGEIDFGTVDPSLWDSLATSDTVNQVPPFGVAIFTFFGYQLDPTKPAAKFFGDKAVRQALLYALDRQQMADKVYFKQASVADSVIPPISWAHSAAKPTYGFDKAKAESMLDAAGWTKGPDGIRAKGGVPMKFTMITNQGNKQREALLQIMQQSWGDIGVSATPQLIQFPQLVTQITNQRTFDIFLVGFSFGQDPDESQLFAGTSANPGGFNGFDFKNTQGDALLNQAAATLDQGKRKSFYAQWQDLMNDQVPAPILVFNKGLWAVNKRVNGIVGTLGPYNQYSSRFFFKDVWVSDGK
ncbi:MAG TPA: ABC transporter substrate-binding protein [Candidatus Dormibacteraeota bacterium]|nr:ABC transporter substrate-binding protein [Candidatus Dormibacteraeota bacterium]